MSESKKKIRMLFRNSVFKRDKFTCKVCGFKSSEANADEELDAHHITDRTLMPNGGYSKYNGITVCLPCHEIVEEWHRSGHKHIKLGLHPNDLYQMINSSYEEAVKYSEKL